MVQFVRRMRTLDSLQKHNYCLMNSHFLYQIKNRCGAIKDWYQMVGSKCKETIDQSRDIFYRGREPMWFMKFKKEVGYCIKYRYQVFGLQQTSHKEL
jgi:hypothetical protein